MSSKATLIAFLILLLAGCGRTTKQPVSIQGPVKDPIHKYEVTLVVSGLTEEDANQSWFVWTLHCEDTEYQGIRGENTGSSVTVKLTVERGSTNSCVLRAGGSTPELAAFFETSTGILYQSQPFDVGADTQMVTVEKQYEGPGAAGIRQENDAEEVEVVTKEGEKCDEFDLETFSCI